MNEDKWNERCKMQPVIYASPKMIEDLKKLHVAGVTYIEHEPLKEFKSYGAVWNQEKQRFEPK